MAHGGTGCVCDRGGGRGSASVQTLVFAHLQVDMARASGREGGTWVYDRGSSCGRDRAQCPVRTTHRPEACVCVCENKLAVSITYAFNCLYMGRASNVITAVAFEVTFIGRVTSAPTPPPCVALSHRGIWGDLKVLAGAWVRHYAY